MVTFYITDAPNQVDLVDMVVSAAYRMIIALH